MDIISVIIALTFLIGLVVAGFKLLGKSSSLREGDDNYDAKPLFKWSGIAALGVAVLMVVFMVDRFLVDIPTPFEGPRVTTEMPNTAPPAAQTAKPNIEAPDGRVTMEGAADVHQQQLKQFEKTE